jgi:hypothetical protein
VADKRELVRQEDIFTVPICTPKELFGDEVRFYFLLNADFIKINLLRGSKKLAHLNPLKPASIVRRKRNLFINIIAKKSG